MWLTNEWESFSLHYVSLSVCLCSCICICLWRPEVTLKYCLSSCIVYFVLRQEASQSTNSRDLSASAFQYWDCKHMPRGSAISYGFRHGTQVLMATWQTFYQLSYLPSPLILLVIWRNCSHNGYLMNTKQCPPYLKTDIMFCQTLNLHNLRISNQTIAHRECEAVHFIPFTQFTLIIET